MSKSTEISATQWLAVRERVVDQMKIASPQSAKDTRVRMAERLILEGCIDVEFMAAEIAAEERAREERIEAARLAREERESSNSQQQEDQI
ncbi:MULTISPECIES: hypothetical protein [unclassified Microbacterium]|uniref:hypothetical protein n=1 Tax=unclassified Microbacterium TaxID=2609290 RepID=UPI003010153E